MSDGDSDVTRRDGRGLRCRVTGSSLVTKMTLCQESDRRVKGCASDKCERQIRGERGSNDVSMRRQKEEGRRGSSLVLGGATESEKRTGACSRNVKQMMKWSASDALVGASRFLGSCSGRGRRRGAVDGWRVDGWMDRT